MKRHEMLDYLGITEDDLPKTLEEAQDEYDASIVDVADIRQQIADEAAGITQRTLRDHNWTVRAQIAARKTQTYVNLLKRIRNELAQQRREEEAKARRAEKQEAQDRHQKHQEEAHRLAQERRRAKLAIHSEHTEGEATVTLAAVREVIKTLPEAERQKFYDAMAAAQEKWRVENMPQRVAAE